ncbi:hypothetical protein TVAG_346390 [Trichomonas vaginalis G3]|uniref:Uncharacterized protein n=1 Tax=Trichomonas vaginalis (strain ATCC PRA-98 / G3) TaxID=412133 RepID=A2GAT3_TRIV3|nr:hypothetical protein TVAGG3_0411660 [Trichomonas vaginalis G3]EAX85734.1 hypothetical protein TVAG_346390 [Trichomonas vaginalis G3]KAI5535391.1 hypothetical protein TVAGG3_0411660 [Trichomonas vaginalis G3]|eukprot:XP_001298664.1 hypothetical protein [Trichomonas vaginalis G3]
MSDFESWKSQNFGQIDSLAKLENIRAVFSKISPLFASLYKNQDKPDEYLNDISAVLAKVFPNDTIPSVSDVNAFTKFLFDKQEVLNAKSIDGIKNIFQYVDVECQIFRPIWEFAEVVNDPHLFLKVLSNAFQRPQSSPMKFNIQVVEMLFDHYCPMLEPTNVDNEQTYVSRIELINALINISEILTKCDDVENTKIVSLLRTITRISRRCKGFISIEAFRLATSLFKTHVMKLSPKIQADELMKFTCGYPRNHPLHMPAIRFGIAMHPEAFGFVSLAKNIINAGIIDQNDVSIISRILQLKYVKNPTDVFSTLYKVFIDNKILASSVRVTVMKAFPKYESILELKNNTKQFINRMIEFISFALKIKKYNHRIQRCVEMLTDFYNLDIAWLHTFIDESCANGFEYGGIPRETLAFCTGNATPDEKMKEVYSIDVKNVNVKEYIEKGSAAVQKPEPTGSKPNSARRGTSKKPTIAEVKAMYRQKMAQGKFTPANDRSLLKAAACACKNSSDEEESEDSTRD